MAYTSNESGRFEVYVQTVPLSDWKWQVSTSGYEPRMAPADATVVVAVWRQSPTLVALAADVGFRRFELKSASR